MKLNEDIILKIKRNKIYKFIHTAVHIRVPHGHDSTVYTTDTNGTAVNISMRSAIDSDKIWLSMHENENDRKSELET